MRPLQMDGAGRRFRTANLGPTVIRNVPGRKTDMKDAEWIAELLRHGLIAGSFVPPLPIQDLRELTRYRAQVAKNGEVRIQMGAGGHSCFLRLVVSSGPAKVDFAKDVLPFSGRAAWAAAAHPSSRPA